MNIEIFRDYCLSKPMVEESFPFGGDTLVFKVMGKIFALSGIDSSPFRANLKMDPELVEEYREKYSTILPGYHMNKKHWNTVILEEDEISLKEQYWLIDHSYDQVVKSLPKKTQKELEELK